MNKIKIFQLKDTDEANRFLFMNYIYVQKRGGINLDNYEEVYSCKRDNSYGLEDAYFEFNMNRPDDFTGHSISVSDIVEINGKKYFCDSARWVEL